MNEQSGVSMVNRKLFRTSLTDVKEQYPQRERDPQRAPSRSSQQSGGAQPRKKPAPPDQTSAEAFYYVKQMQSHTPVAVVLSDGETLHGTVEWYDKDCIKLTRFGSPNLLIYKQYIKYLYKDGEDAAHGGNGNHHQ
jgi:host factor-I protein